TEEAQPVGLEVENKRAYARDVAAGAIEAGDETAPDRVGASHVDDRYSRGRRLGRQCRYLAAWCNNDRHLSTHEIGGERGQLIVLSVGPAIVQGDVSTLEESDIFQALQDQRDERRVDGRRTRAENAAHRHRRLLRARRQRPRCRRAAEQRDELAPFHSITSSARNRNDEGTLRPSAFAVLRLTVNWTLTGSW